jgi:hypothetical protein
MNTEGLIKCPKCSEEIVVADAISKQLEEKYRRQAQERQNAMETDFKRRQLELEKSKKELEAMKAEEERLLAQKVQSELKAQSERLRKEVEDKHAAEMVQKEKELAEKSIELKEFYKMKADMSRLQREKQELKDRMEAEAQEKLNRELLEQARKLREELNPKNDLRVKELEQKLAAQVALTEEMKRKQEQGSMQLQGEAQELLIEEWLMRTFPFDEVTEVKKGVRGADVLLRVKPTVDAVAGTILCESKRAQNFSNDWIRKIKEDMAAGKADVGVLITSVYPAGVERMALHEGVWVCSLNEFKGLVQVLRRYTLDLHQMRESQQNSGEKMQLLYNYLTSPEFKSRVEAIVEGFTQMQDDLLKERKSMTSMWEKRQKQIDKVLLNTTGMYGAIRGFASNEMPAIKELELPDTDLLPES